MSVDSLRFRITVPDGVLLDHLDGRTPKGRSAEIIRLATNYLCLCKNMENPFGQIQHGMVTDNGRAKEVESTNNEKEQPPSEQPESAGNLVDLGEDLLSME